MSEVTTKSVHSAVRAEYLARHADEISAAVTFARDLMRGDPDSFQAGYSAPNAAISAAEVFEVTASEVAAHLWAP